MGQPNVASAPRDLFRAYHHQAWLRACSNPVGKALWFIESLFATDISLDELARIAGVPRHHLVRAFAGATGQSILRYVRGRRLTEAARLLANGPPDVLSVAIEYGYSSHESFSRAFFDEFGISPERVRAQRHLDSLELVEPMQVDDKLLIELEPPRFEDGGELLIAGLGRRYNAQTMDAIPAQWQRFAALIDRIPGRVGKLTYGVRCNADDAGNLDYVCGVEVADLAAMPSDLHRLHIVPQQYAVFRHRANVSEVRRTWHTIWNQWLPQSAYEAVAAPDFERYDERFDPRTGNGGLEIWVPVHAAGGA
jgi:AraC family transcriptional regulator